MIKTLEQALNKYLFIVTEWCFDVSELTACFIRAPQKEVDMLWRQGNQGQTEAPDSRCLQGHQIKANPIKAKEIFIFVQLPLKVFLLLGRQFYRKQQVPNAKMSSHDQRAEYWISQENTADPSNDDNIQHIAKRCCCFFFVFSYKTSNYKSFLEKGLKLKYQMCL